MKTSLRLGIAGCGDIAGFMAWFARLNRCISLIACCDRELEKARRFAQHFKIPQVHETYAHMLESASLDAVYLAVPHDLHYTMLMEALRAELPTLVEKPITCTLEEGLDVARMADRVGVPLGVNYQYRYDSGCYALARAVQEGALGLIFAARCNLAWRREDDYFERSSWHAQLKRAGGGTLITQGSHLIDVALWALGERPRSVMGYSARRKFPQVEVEDLVQATIETESGALLQICSSMAAKPSRPLSIELYGEKGTAVYTDRPWPRVRFRGVRVRRARPPVRGIHALGRSLEAFRAWVMEGKPYLTPAWEALPALAVVEAIYRSTESGQREVVVPVQPLEGTKWAQSQ
ncbi:MAG: Gfo/Idh/MocA family oxidoreductase [Anaerolineales bacterium]